MALLQCGQTGAATASGLANWRASPRCRRPITLFLGNSRCRSRCPNNLRPIDRGQPVAVRDRRREMGIRTRREPEARRRHIAGYEGRYRRSQSGRLEAPAGPSRPSRATCLLVHLMRRLFKRRFWSGPRATRPLPRRGVGLVVAPRIELRQRPIRSSAGRWLDPRPGPHRAHSPSRQARRALR